MLSRRFIVSSLCTCALAAALAGCGGDASEPAVSDAGAVDSTASDALVDSAREAASDAPVTPDAPDAIAEDAADAAVDYCKTTSVGQPCGAEQPCVGGFICYGVAGSTGFCAPPTPQCGGFVMAMCPAGKPCLRPKGSSLGYCATEEEKPCVCKPGSGVDGC